jgi:uncharacterized RDD family membrane protein YckC
MTHQEGQPALDIAGFWRRIGAFVIDVLILGMAGLIVGFFLFDDFARLGAFGRLLGFVIALGYFGFCNSNFFGGQTLGKKMLGLRVADANGQLISLPRSLLRYTVLGVPYFLNGLPLNPQAVMSSWLSYLLAVIVFGVGFSIFYLYIFNRRTRQSLHDLAVGSYVVRVQPDEQVKTLLPVWRGHLVVVALLIALSLTTPAVASRLSQTQFFADLLPTYQALATQPHVQSAMVTKSWVSMNGQPAKHYLVAQLRLDASLTTDKELAENAARLMAKHYPDYVSQNAVVVNLSYGYDIGIASGWRRQSYTFKPEELQ